MYKIVYIMCLHSDLGKKYVLKHDPMYFFSFLSALFFAIYLFVWKYAEYSGKYRSPFSSKAEKKHITEEFAGAPCVQSCARACFKAF